MKDGSTPKEQLVRKVESLRQRLLELEATHAEWMREEGILREREGHYRMLAELSQDFIFVIGRGYSVRYINTSAAEEYGKRPEDMVGKRLGEFFPPEVFRRLRRNLHKVFETGTIVTIEDRIPFPDRELWLHTQLIPLKKRRGKVNAVLGIARDITTLKQAEEALRKSEERARCLAEAAVEGMFIHDKGEILAANDVCARMFGYAASEMVGMNTLGFVVPECRAVVETSMSSGYERSYEVVALRKDGATFPAEVCGKPIAYQGRMVRVTSVRDLTDRKKMEGESLKAHKLESIVILSAGIAHDFNNILTTIMANLTLAKTYAKQGDELSKLLREAKRASLRARGLIEQLLAFSKGEAPVKKHASIKELLRGTVDVALSGSNVKVAFAIQEDLWEVEVDEVQIGQVIDNLVLNARQAMPDGGSMEVRAENRIVGKGEMPPLAEGRYVRVSIWDQGSGIPEENLDKVFDPYFTTKEKGNGLGLAIAYSIVKKHDGHIALESKVGVGTAFHVFLPSCN